MVTRELTGIFAIYNVAGALAGALGALASGLPSFLASRFGWNMIAAQRSGFVAYSAVALIAAIVYRSLSGAVEVNASPVHIAPLAKSRGIVVRLATLFSLDAFGGGFVIQSLLALWLFRRFNMSVQAAGVFFCAAGLLGSLSQFVSVALAARIGRIRTMVYTHVPSNAFLILAAMMPSAKLTIVFLLLRSSLSQMDVPARQSYVMAVVPPEERAAAAGVTNVPRSLAAALAPVPAGMLLDASSLGWPLICAGGLKVLYDFLLLLQFRSVKPADELYDTESPHPSRRVPPPGSKLGSLAASFTSEVTARKMRRAKANVDNPAGIDVLVESYLADNLAFVKQNQTPDPKHRREQSEASRVVGALAEAT